MPRGERRPTYVNQAFSGRSRGLVDLPEVLPAVSSVPVEPSPSPEPVAPAEPLPPASLPLTEEDELIDGGPAPVPDLNIEEEEPEPVVSLPPPPKAVPPVKVKPKRKPPLPHVAAPPVPVFAHHATRRRPLKGGLGG